LTEWKWFETTVLSFSITSLKSVIDISSGPVAHGQWKLIRTSDICQIFSNRIYINILIWSFRASKFEDWNQICLCYHGWKFPVFLTHFSVFGNGPDSSRDSCNFDELFLGWGMHFDKEIKKNERILICFSSRKFSVFIQKNTLVCLTFQTSWHKKDGTWTELTWFETTIFY
jgi:hypothetical protein